MVRVVFCVSFFFLLDKQASAAKGTGSGATMPRSERLCKALPKVMETAIRGVQDLDEQVKSWNPRLFCSMMMAVVVAVVVVILV